MEENDKRQYLNEITDDISLEDHRNDVISSKALSHTTETHVFNII